MINIDIEFPKYKLFSYEKDLAYRELDGVVSMFDANYSPESHGATINVPSTACIESVIEELKKLTYFQYILIQGDKYETIQSTLEQSCPKSGKTKRQSTRYGAHGLHEYKGKFNPQIVSSITRLFGLEQNAKVLEPFCGSGTTLYESAIKGLSSVGFDFNPLAPILANVKLDSLYIDKSKSYLNISEVINRSKGHYQATSIGNDERSKYLANWFEREQLLKIETLLNDTESAANIDVHSKNILLMNASNLIREYSQQEPADLRIRRRKSSLPNECFFIALQLKVDKFFESISSLDDLGIEFKSKSKISKAYNIDIRSTGELSKFSEQFDGAITSPPYATALPYIDTQRLSLIWLKLATPKEVKQLENSLIGSREFTKAEERKLREELLQNQSLIPETLHSLCLKMLDSLNESDGFRRRAMPYLLYRYFTDMKLMFQNVLMMLKDDASFALVVGHNQTTLGGIKFDLNTPQYLSLLAESVGWKQQELTALDVYRRYDLHQVNSINCESLLVLKK